MEKENYSTRIIPFVKFENYVNGKGNTKIIENLTMDEVKNMSCNPRMIKEIRGQMYLMEMPLLFNEGVSIKRYLCYAFDELQEEEQKKYFERSIVIPATIENVVKVSDKTSKKILGKKKKKLDY